MSTKHYQAAYDEFGEALSDWLRKNAPEHATWRPDLAIASVWRPDLAIASVGEAAVTLIAKRDERIEALERRLAALEGDAK